MTKSSQFLVATIVLDVFLLIFSNVVNPPGDPEIYGIVGIFVVSPLLAYFIVYRLEYGRWMGESTSSTERKE